MRFFCEWMLAMTSRARAQTYLARAAAAPYYSGLVRQRRRRRGGIGRTASPDRRRRVARNTAIFSIATGISRVAGLVREIVAAQLLRHDAAAPRRSRSPSRSRTWSANLFANAALSAAFVPVFTDLLQQGRRKEAFRLASTLFWIMLIVLGAITAFFILARRRDHAAVHRARRSTRYARPADGRPLAGAVPGRAAARAQRACSSGSCSPTTTSRSRRSRRRSGTS